MYIWLQSCLPQHLITRLTGKLAECRWSPLKNWMVKTFINHYQVNMDEAQQSDYREFPTFNAFFTRALKPGARTIANNPSVIASPVDGGIYELGKIEEGTLLQAKGHEYSLQSLFGGDQAHTDRFNNGSYLTAYLSPKDYHRIHLPCDARLLKMVHVPGCLYSVNPYTINNCPNIFARNERVICYFDTATGPMAMVLVGAIIVGSIETAWHGVVTPPTGKTIQEWNYDDQDIRFAQGDELGCFRLGSTVIILFGPNQVSWDASLETDTPLQMGQLIGVINVS